ncbi:MAG: hypothetical protein JWM16_3546 [Verrucomicrobiales bacterium]|nr:hypothetical protein [Verrucomicrobiales bacterium]
MTTPFQTKRGSLLSRWTLVLLLLLPLALRSQPGSLDLTFAPVLSSGALVYTVHLQPDGKILIGGSFQSVNGQSRANVARLNSDGTLDPSFDPGQAADVGYVNAIMVQEDGKILIGGAFYSSAYQNPNNLARLNANGSVDYNFDPSLYLDAAVNAIALQDEGFIVIAGAFEVVDGFYRRNVARLFPDGSLDMSFDACVASTSGAGATAVVVLPDGKLLVTGKFTFAGDRARDGIARLLDCGDLDDSYAPQPGMESSAIPYALALQTNGNTFLGGNFFLYHNLLRPGIVELDTNGLPSDFNPGTGFFGGTVYTITFQHDQKLLVGGNFSTYNFAPVNHLARLFSNGALDTSFNPGAGPNDSVSSIVLQNGKYLVAGKFSSFDGVPRSGLARLNGDPVPPRLSPPEPTAPGGCRFLFQGEPERYYVIEASTNLADWLSITNFKASSTPTPVTDGSSFPRRFYRAVEIVQP